MNIAKDHSGGTHPVVSSEQWVEQRKRLLAREKELTELRDRVAQERRALAWEGVEKSYVFHAPEGPRTLAELFDGRSQLVVQHFMFMQRPSASPLHEARPCLPRSTSTESPNSCVR